MPPVEKAHSPISASLGQPAAAQSVEAGGEYARIERAAAPDVVTVAESGFPGFEAIAWFGLLAPAATPQPVLR